MNTILTINQFDIVSGISPILRCCGADLFFIRITDCAFNCTQWELRLSMRCDCNHKAAQYGTEDYWDFHLYQHAVSEQVKGK